MLKLSHEYCTILSEKCYFNLTIIIIRIYQMTIIVSAVIVAIAVAVWYTGSVLTGIKSYSFLCGTWDSSTFFSNSLLCDNLSNYISVNSHSESMTGFWVLGCCNLIAQKKFYDFRQTFRKMFFVSFSFYHLNESKYECIPHFYLVLFIFWIQKANMHLETLWRINKTWSAYKELHAN